MLATYGVGGLSESGDWEVGGSQWDYDTVM